MKTNVTYIDAAKFEALIAESGLPYLTQSGFVKVQGPKGRQVYVAATKRVGRVDLSGFVMKDGDQHLPGFQAPHMGESGNVKQQLDFSRSEAEILETFKELLEHLKTLAPVEKAERKAPEKKADEAKGWSTPNGKQQRLEKIKQAAKATGPVA